MWVFKVPLLTAAIFYFPSRVAKSEARTYFQSGAFSQPARGTSRIAGAATVRAWSGQPLLRGSSDVKGQEHPQQKQGTRFHGTRSQGLTTGSCLIRAAF